MRRPRYSAVQLLVTLGLLFVVAPLVEDIPQGDLIEAVLVTLVMVFAVVAIGSRTRVLVVALVLFLLALVGKWTNHLRPELLHPAVYLATSFLFFAFVIAQLVTFIVRAPRVDANVLCGGVSGFLMLGLLWTPAYLTLARWNPASFNLPSTPGSPATLDGFTAFYFSFITLCTVGYGDITPVSRAARMLSVLEAIAGLFYMALLISRLVSVYSSAQLTRAHPPDQDT
jgi:hypothetical protein